MLNPLYTPTSRKISKEIILLKKGCIDFDFKSFGKVTSGNGDLYITNHIISPYLYRSSLNGSYFRSIEDDCQDTSILYRIDNENEQGHENTEKATRSQEDDWQVVDLLPNGEFNTCSSTSQENKTSVNQ